MFPDLTKIIGFFMKSVQARFSNIYIILTLPGVYQFIPGLMTFTSFQGHRYVTIIHCKLFCKIHVHHSLNCMLITYIKKIRHSMPCVTGVHFGDIPINTILFYFVL